MDRRFHPVPDWLLDKIHGCVDVGFFCYIAGATKTFAMGQSVSITVESRGRLLACWPGKKAVAAWEL